MDELFCVHSCDAFLCRFLFLVGCWGPEAAVGTQPDPVPRKPVSVGQRSGRIPQPPFDCARDWAHTQQLCSRSVRPSFLLACKLFRVFLVTLWTCISMSRLLFPRLPILPHRERAEGCDQKPHRPLRWCSARFLRPLCLHDVQGAGQAVRLVWKSSIFWLHLSLVSSSVWSHVLTICSASLCWTWKLSDAAKSKGSLFCYVETHFFECCIYM